MPGPRTHISLRASDEEREKLRRIADHHGLDLTSAFRLLLAQEIRRIDSEPKPRKPRKSATPAE